MTVVNNPVPALTALKSKLVDSWVAEAMAAGTHNGPSVEIPRGADNISFSLGTITADRTTGDETYDVKLEGRMSPDEGWSRLSGLAFTQIATASPAGEQLPTAANAPGLRLPRFIRTAVVTAGTTPVLTAYLYMWYRSTGPGKVADHGAVS